MSDLLCTQTTRSHNFRSKASQDFVGKPAKGDFFYSNGDFDSNARWSSLGPLTRDSAWGLFEYPLITLWNPLMHVQAPNNRRESQ
jgi:hypothetical protein